MYGELSQRSEKKWNKACSSVRVLKQKQPVLLDVLVLMSFSSVRLERQHKPHCSDTAKDPAKDANRIAVCHS